MRTQVGIVRPYRSRRNASAMVLLAFLIPVVLAVAAYSINVVYMELVRTELQIGTDIATRAAGRTLAVTGDKELAIEAAKRLAAANTVSKIPLTLKDSDVLFGVSTRASEAERYDFFSGPNPNAVRLRTESFAGEMINGVPMVFPTMGVPISFRPLKTAISTQAELDVALVLDRSGSMAYADDEVSGVNPPAAAPFGWVYGAPVPPNARWLDATASVQAFLDIVSASCQDERVSLSTYSTLPSTDVKLTTQYSEITSELLRHSFLFLGGTTNIGGGIMEGVGALGDKRTSRPWASRVMIVLSDGNHNTGYDPIAAATAAASQQVTIYTISFSAEANQTTMKQIAEIGSGTHYHAATGTELMAAFREIAESLPTLLTF
jgi:Ca-activated chloride channel homolog